MALLSGASGENLFLPLPVFDGFEHFLTCDHITLIFASVFTLTPRLYACSKYFCLPLMRICDIGLVQTVQDNLPISRFLNQPHLQRPRFSPNNVTLKVPENMSWYLWEQLFKILQFIYRKARQQRRKWRALSKLSDVPHVPYVRKSCLL